MIIYLNNYKNPHSQSLARILYCSIFLEVGFAVLLTQNTKCTNEVNLSFRICCIYTVHLFKIFQVSLNKISRPLTDKFLIDTLCCNEIFIYIYIPFLVQTYQASCLYWFLFVNPRDTWIWQTNSHCGKHKASKWYQTVVTKCPNKLLRRISRHS